MELELEVGAETRGILQEIRLGGNCHRCDRFCTFRHVFGNLFECQRSGKNHVCDQNCTELVYYDSSTRVCRLSKKVFQQGSADETQGARRRRREASPAAIEKKVCRQ